MVRQIKTYIILLLLAAGSPLWAQPVRPGWLIVKDITSASLKSATSASVKSAVEKAARQALVPTQEALTKSIFRAYPKGKEGTHAFSGFTFETMYKGEKEIFGVIAQHTVPLRSGDGEIGQHFTARVLVNGHEKDIPAEIVQFTSPAFLDVALVKFRPEDEPLLTPLPLAEHEPTMGDGLQTIGFATDQLTSSPTMLFENTLISLRFPIGIPYARRAGLCGSPVLNEQGEVVGVFTGDRNKVDDYLGFATKSSYLRPLVAAYHNDLQHATFPLILGEHKIADLKPNEFVSFIEFDDDEMRLFWYRVVDYKFPYNTAMEQLPNARILKIRINKATWTGEELEEASNDDNDIIYDLKEKKIIWSDR